MLQRQNDYICYPVRWNRKMFSTWAGFTIVLKLFRGTLVNIKAGSHKISRKWLRSIVAKIALWNNPQELHIASHLQKLDDVNMCSGVYLSKKTTTCHNVNPFYSTSNSCGICHNLTLKFQDGVRILILDFKGQTYKKCRTHQMNDNSVSN